MRHDKPQLKADGGSMVRNAVGILFILELVHDVSGIKRTYQGPIFAKILPPGALMTCTLSRARI